MGVILRGCGCGLKIDHLFNMGEVDFVEDAGFFIVLLPKLEAGVKKLWPIHIMKPYIY